MIKIDIYGWQFKYPVLYGCPVVVNPQLTLLAYIALWEETATSWRDPAVTEGVGGGGCWGTANSPQRSPKLRYWDCGALLAVRWKQKPMCHHILNDSLKSDLEWHHIYIEMCIRLGLECLNASNVNLDSSALTKQAKIKMKIYFINPHREIRSVVSLPSNVT